MAKSKTEKQVASLQQTMIYVAVILGVLVIISLGYNVKVSNTLTEIKEQLSEVQAAPAPAPSDGGDAPAPAPTPTVEVSADDDAVKGKDNAPVEIIEFSDFQCPFCARWYTDTMPQIQKEYIDTGKVKLVFRDFPLNQIHPLAQKASEAAECADDQGKFWEMHDILFENPNALDVASLKQHAADLGMDTDDFDDCLDSGKYTDEVNKDLADGRAAGVSGTPSFFINGKKIVGAHPFATFQQAIDAELI
ncbi:DsbA family protein [Nanoarchaeota archaeon]